MEVLKNVLIKEIVGPDMVMVVDNLPKHFIYQQVPKLVHIPRWAVDYDRTEPHLIEAYTLRDRDMPDEPRNRRVTHEMVDELLPGIEKSQTNDGGFVFWVHELPEAKERLATIDRYIRSVINPAIPIPSRVPYTSVEKSFSAAPKSLSLIPRIELAAMPVFPPTAEVKASVAVQESSVSPSVILTAKGRKKRAPLTEEQKNKLRSNMAAARAKKSANAEAAKPKASV